VSAEDFEYHCKNTASFVIRFFFQFRSLSSLKFVFEFARSHANKQFLKAMLHANMQFLKAMLHAKWCSKQSRLFLIGLEIK
jgi:hypothetical protein